MGDMTNVMTWPEFWDHYEKKLRKRNRKRVGR